MESTAHLKPVPLLGACAWLGCACWQWWLHAWCYIQPSAALSFGPSTSEAPDADLITHICIQKGPGSGLPGSWAQNWYTGSPAFLLTLPKTQQFEISGFMRYHQALCNQW